MGKTAILKLDIISDFNDKGVKSADTSMRSLTESAGKAAAVVGVGLVAGAGKSVKAASDLGESVNAVNKTFGDSSDTIKAFGAVSAEQAGLSTRAFQELSTKTGASLTNLGYSNQEAADSTVELTKRAADMASVMNTDVDTALEAINSGIRGEAEPLKQFGVSLDETTLKNQAMAMGLYDGVGALDASTKALATEAVILDQTKKYMGDFEETSGEAANAQKVLGAQTEDLAAQFGTALLPTVEAALAAMSTMVGIISENQGAFNVLIGVVAAVTAAILALNVGMKAYDTVAKAVGLASKALNSQFVKSTAGVVKNTAAWVANKAAMLAQKAVTLAIKGATAAYTAVQWALNAALTANPIGLIIAAIAALVAAIVIAYKKSDTFRKLVDKLWRLLRNSVVRAFDAVSSAIRKLVDWFQKAWAAADRLIRKLKDIVTPKLSFPSFPGFGGFSVNGTAGPSTQGAGSQAALTSPSGNTYITVQGAIDPVGTAETIRRLLARQDSRIGRPVVSPWQAT